MRIKVGDEVEVIAGNDQGVRGTVQRIIRKENRVVISGVNVVKKHAKARPSSGRTPTQGGIIEFEAPIDISNVMVIDPSSGEPTRVGIRYDEDGRRVRYAKRSGTELD